jgi:lipid-A-disaccharide synthase-like uncharacterized protein
MHWSDLLWLGVGFVAQVFFAGRFLSQWLLSERAGRSLMPVHFWYLSVAGSMLLLAYAIHRRDPVIATGQLIGLGIYLRNLRFIDRGWMGRHSLPVWLGLVAAASVTGYHLGPDSASKSLLLHDFWTAFGFIGQSLFTGRFIIQWWMTERARQSVVPRYFWYLSIAGTLMLLVYAIAVVDPVIMLGQGLGLVLYTRNLILLNRSALSATAARAP